MREKFGETFVLILDVIIIAALMSGLSVFVIDRIDDVKFAKEETQAEVVIRKIQRPDSPVIQRVAAAHAAKAATPPPAIPSPDERILPSPTPVATIPDFRDTASSSEAVETDFSFTYPAPPNIDMSDPPEGVRDAFPEGEFDYTGLTLYDLNYCYPGQPWGDGGCNAPWLSPYEVTYYWTCGWYWAHFDLDFIMMKDIPEWCGRDTDGDGVPDKADLCPKDPKKISPGVCGCGIVDINTGGTVTCP